MCPKGLSSSKILLLSFKTNKMHGEKGRKDYVKKEPDFFFSRRVYHLIVGSSLIGDILSRFGYESHLQNQGFPGSRVTVHSCHGSCGQEEPSSLAVTTWGNKIGSPKLCQ